MKKSKTLRISIAAQPTPRPRFRWVQPKGRQGFGTTYYPAKYKRFTEDLKAAIESAWDMEPLEYVKKIEIEIILPRPSTLTHPFPSGDWDNYAKGIQDCCNGVVVVDDNRIQSASVIKRYGKEAEVRIKVHKFTDSELEDAFIEAKAL